MLCFTEGLFVLHTKDLISSVNFMLLLLACAVRPIENASDTMSQWHAFLINILGKHCAERVKLVDLKLQLIAHVLLHIQIYGITCIVKPALNEYLLLLDGYGDLSALVESERHQALWSFGEVTAQSRFHCLNIYYFPYRCHFSQVLQPIFDETATKVKSSFPVRLHSVCLKPSQ